MVTSVTKAAGTQKLPKPFRLSERTDMTIQWKALGETLSDYVRFNHFWGKNTFSEFF
jgi:hypothetical protein